VTTCGNFSPYKYSAVFTGIKSLKNAWQNGGKFMNRLMPVLIPEVIHISVYRLYGLVCNMMAVDENMLRMKKQ